MYPLYPLVLSLCLSSTWARPVRMNEDSNPATSLDLTTLSSSLGEYYEGITDQVMISFSQSLASNKATSEGFARSLDQHLEYLHSNLIAAIQPLVDSNLPWVISPPSHAEKKKIKDEEDDDDEDEDDDEDDDDESAHLNIWSIPLKKDIRVLNKRISSQLGKIIHTNTLQTFSGSFTHQFSLYRVNESQDWLQQQLLTIEKTLEREFNKRIHQVIQCILEDFVL